MAIIVKVKDDGSKKGSLSVDLKRSGANAVARILERVVLPGLGDAVRMMLYMLALWEFWGFAGPRRVPGTDFDVGLVSGDFSDAYSHFRVAEGEQRHCLSPDVLLESFLLWVHMCFGLKGAPLIC